MHKAVFISRHNLTKSQTDLLERAGCVGETVADFDAFASESDLKDLIRGLKSQEVRLVITVHQLLAMRLAPHFKVGTFNNKTRASLGQPPDFFTDQLVIVNQVPSVGAWDLLHNSTMQIVE